MLRFGNAPIRNMRNILFQESGQQGRDGTYMFLSYPTKIGKPNCPSSPDPESQPALKPKT